MIDISRLYALLNPEQLKAMEEVLEKRENTLERFKGMRKKYSGVKNNIKRIEKKMVIVMDEAGDENFVCKWIGREVESIEKKYAVIEHAIKHYHQYMRQFNRTVNTPLFFSFDPNEMYRGPVWNLHSDLSGADVHINYALDAIRITQRYFKNIASAFKGHANLMAIKRQAAERLRLNEMKLMKESGKPEEQRGESI